MGEGLRLRPEEDTLTVREGILGAYPNMFFVLDESASGRIRQGGLRHHLP